MIGRNEEVQVGGGARFRGLEIQTAESNANATNIIGTVRSPDLRKALEAANQETGLELKFRYDNNSSNLMRRSDHWPFIQRGVPAVWVHTGLHPDYHTVAAPRRSTSPRWRRSHGWCTRRRGTSRMRPRVRRCSPQVAQSPQRNGRIETGVRGLQCRPSTDFCFRFSALKAREPIALGGVAIRAIANELRD